MRFTRKGITPVIATVMLLTISVAATASAYTFIVNTQKDVEQGIQEDLNQQEIEDKSNLNIEYVYNSSNNFTIINVRNTGAITLTVENQDGKKIWSLYSDGQPVGSGVDGRGWEYYQSSPTPPVTLNPSDIISLNTTVRFPPRGESKSFRLVGEYETRDTHVCFNSGTPNC